MQGDFLEEAFMAFTRRALVIGAEGAGVGKLLREHCDMVAAIPMKGEINSLNASVAAGVLAYEVARQRRG